jgi:hypothetical protein
MGGQQTAADVRISLVHDYAKLPSNNPDAGKTPSMGALAKPFRIPDRQPQEAPLIDV